MSCGDKVSLTSQVDQFLVEFKKGTQLTDDNEGKGKDTNRKIYQSLRMLCGTSVAVL